MLNFNSSQGIILFQTDNKTFMKKLQTNRIWTTVNKAQKNDDDKDFCTKYKFSVFYSFYEQQKMMFHTVRAREFFFALFISKEGSKIGTNKIPNSSTKCFQCTFFQIFRTHFCFKIFESSSNKPWCVFSQPWAEIASFWFYHLFEEKCAQG